MNENPTHSGNILVVDDTVENLRLLANMLGQKGYEVRPVTNGRQALETAERSVPDLILLDVTMPEMDGYEVCRRLKSSEQLRDVPVIFLTALTETADKLKAFGVGAVDYISKPFQIDEVYARVQAHVALKRAHGQLVKNYEQLRELEQLRDNLVHMIIHDMRTPLTIIAGNLELFSMIMASDLTADASKILESAKTGTRNLSNMTNDLLDVSKMEEGKLSLNRESCDLAGLARETSEAIGAMDRTRTPVVDAEGVPALTCDKAIMRRILQNLLSNAIKHTPDGSLVRVTVGEAGPSIRVCVIDSGPGVPVESRQRIFEKFGATEARKEGKYHSAGLGLAFCRLAVEAHGGTIGVDDHQPTGSVFWFEIPK